MQTDIAPSVTTGTRCYIPDKDNAWLPVYVEAVDEVAQRATVRLQRPRQDDPTDHDDTDFSGEIRDVALHTGFPLQNLQLSREKDGVANMIDLNHLHEAALLRNLKKRFGARMPYTYTGDICLAVNPYQWLEELYTPGLHQKYLQARTRQDLPPHVYAISVAAFKHMCKHGSNQSILVSGESGAGKTETTKILMDNLAIIASSPTTTSNPNDDITTRILQINPLLESFGNAKTTRNDNSSRFGKFTQLQFTQKHTLCGAQCETYLLEKTRVVSHERGERNYHIFYQLLHGLTATESETMGFLEKGPNFAYLAEKEDNPSGQPMPRLPTPLEAEMANDRTRFGKTREALSLLGLENAQQTELFEVLAGILHLGEAQFVAKVDNDEACDLVPDSIVYTSVLLGLDPETMARALTHRTMKAAGDVYLVPLTVTQAASGRDALAKAIYASIFDWLVAGINVRLGAASRGTCTTIGVLDIFGFESFEHNSFEQLCINYANEKLQQKFTQDVFRAVQEEYTQEAITWAHIAYTDNSETLALIEGRMGVLALLNEEIRRPRGNDQGFVSKLSGAYLKHTTLVAFPRTCKTQFAIHHYAGTVLYEATGFLDKHKDALVSDLSDLMCHSHNAFPQMLFSVRAEMEAAEEKGQRSKGRKNGPHRVETTVGMQFKQSLNALMTTINKTNVNYIRCIKPNRIKSATVIEDQMVAKQLQCAGVIEAICIARVGYPIRLSHLAFADQFDFFLLPQDRPRNGATCGTRLCHEIVQQFHLETPTEYQMGVTKIYLQKGVVEKLERIKAERIFAHVAKIQAQWRGMVARCHYSNLCVAVVKIQRRAKVFVLRTRFCRVRNALGLIQRVGRGYIGRCVYHSVLQSHSCLIIQRVWRGYIGRCVYHSVLQSHACLIIQRVWRGYFGRCVFQSMLRTLQSTLRTQSCLIIQRVWRGYSGRRLFGAMVRQTRAVQLQCCVRQYLARKHVKRRRVAHVAKLQKEKEAREAREAKVARLDAERRRKEQKVLHASALKIQRNVRGYFARCVVAAMVEAKARRQQEEEEARVRVQRLQAEAAVEAKKRAADERKRKALRMRLRREKAVTVMQRIVRGHLVRHAVDARHVAATKIQRMVRGFVVRQDVARARREKKRREEASLALRLEKSVKEKDHEVLRVVAENAALKQRLEEVQAKNRELEDMVAECRCDCNVVKASTTLKRVELTQDLKAQYTELDRTRGEYATLCAFFEKSGSSHRSTASEEPTLSDRSSDTSSTYGEEETNNWKEDRPTVNSLSASYFGGDRPSTDIAKLLSSSQVRLVNAVQQRRHQARQVVQQRKQQATSAMQQRKDSKAKRRKESSEFSKTMPVGTKTTKWGGFARSKGGKGKLAKSFL